MYWLKYHIRYNNILAITTKKVAFDIGFDVDSALVQEMACKGRGLRHTPFSTPHPMPLLNFPSNASA